MQKTKIHCDSCEEEIIVEENCEGFTGHYLLKYGDKIKKSNGIGVDDIDLCLWCTRKLFINLYKKVNEFESKNEFMQHLIMVMLKEFRIDNHEMINIIKSTKKIYDHKILSEKKFSDKEVKDID